MNFKQVVVSRLQNIGDMIVFLPALKRLRENLPDARITLLGKHEGGIEIAKQCPWIDDIIVIQNRSLREKLRIIYKFRKMHIDLFIVSPQDQGKVPWAVMGGAKKIAAFHDIWDRGVVKREKWKWGINIPLMFDRNKTETENSIRLIDAALEASGVKVESQPDLYPVYDNFKPVTPAKINKLLRQFKNDSASSIIVSSVISKGSSKNWPAENYILLFKRLISNNNAQIILIGAESDTDKNNEIMKYFNSTEMISFVGKFSIDESAYLIKEADLYIGTDSGPAHIAYAVGTPSVVFFKKENVARWLTPYNIQIKTVIIAENNDIKSIAEETVFNACQKFIQSKMCTGLNNQ
ncbi:MAG: glycosyltransferase family 9 protein [Lentisphaerota bacterium]